ncbi:hypothetical protein HK105_206004 [Polyrhizophydium stewartii]|uniref:Uncharacterized protein n=1 Tax=Polyrhizophydium stewartii TaxID=2732419 RepID=A0ABR4N4G5_9FUNG
MHSSLWDRLPAELQWLVLDAAGPLTLFLAGRLDAKGDAVKRAVWADALRLDWEGHLACLPAVDLHAEQAMCVCMYWRLKALGVAHSGVLVHAAARNRIHSELAALDPESRAEVAAASGCVPLLADLVAAGVAVEPWLGFRAAAFGQAVVVEWLARHLPASADMTGVMDAAVASGQAAVVERLHELRGCSCSSWAAAEAVQRRHTAAVALVVRLGLCDDIGQIARVAACVPGSTASLDALARAGHTHQLAMHADRAALGGPANLAWFATHLGGCFSTQALTAAAWAGKLASVEWLLRNIDGVDWDIAAAAAAADRSAVRAQTVELLHKHAASRRAQAGSRQ